MRKLSILLLVLLLSGCRSVKDDNDIETLDITNYYIDASLNPESKTLDVDIKIDYLNQSINFDELFLKIYPNAYNVTDNPYNMQINYLEVNGEDTTYQILGVDETTMNFDLNETLLVGERVVLEISYTLNYWDKDRIFSDEFGNYFVTMFFYPFVAMYDDNGWNLDTYSFRGESYYNDIGNYYVNLDLPREYILATGGEIIFETIEDNITKYEVELLGGRDYSFSASLNYIEYDFTIDGIDVRILSLENIPSNRLNEVTTIIENSFELYTRVIGEYPYDYFTLELGYIYGMESSSIIYCYYDISDITIIHEIVHQWLYSIIGNDQADESWLDEGLTTFATGLYFFSYDNDISAEGYYYHYDSTNPRFDDRILEIEDFRIIRNIEYFGDDYGYLVYYYGATILNYFVLEHLDGDYEFMTRVFNEYYDSFNGKIATIDDFLDILEQESGLDYTKEWFILHLESYQPLSSMPN